MDEGLELAGATPEPQPIGLFSAGDAGADPPFREAQLILWLMERDGRMILRPGILLHVDGDTASVAIEGAVVTANIADLSREYALPARRNGGAKS